MDDNLKHLFLLDPDVTFLNHGSFGACPRPVFEAYQSWQRELERQPLAFNRRLEGHMAEARRALAAFLSCAPDEVVYTPNPTTAINMVARSLKLKPGDEILTSDHEYGAMDRTWRFISQKTGAKYIRQPLPLPMTSAEALLETFWRRVTPRTRVVFLSHITSPTALRLPVEAVCRRAREEDILSIVDGAHAPGQIPLDLPALGADIYTGACHKWLCSPKGSAFLYTRREVQDRLEPLVVSWGWEADRPGPSRYINHHEWQGTRDPAAFLATPTAIAFQQEQDWESVRQRCHLLVVRARERLNALTGLAPLCPPDQQWFVQMFAVRLPTVDPDQLQTRLYEEYAIEIVAQHWNQQPLLRVSIQAYNDDRDIDHLLRALTQTLK